MADTLFSLPRDLRQTGVLVGNGGSVYGPFSFKIFDTQDASAYVRNGGAGLFTPVNVTVNKVGNLPFDFFTVTFPMLVPATMQYVVVGARLPERSAGLTKGNGLNPAALDKELSKTAVTEQELRRDVDRSLKSQFGDPVQILPPSDGVSLLGWSQGNKLVNRPSEGASAAAAEEAADRAEAAAYRQTLTSFGAKGDGGDDTAAIVAALASGKPLTGAGRVYGVTGVISLHDNSSLWDATFKQLAPGASLNVVTLEGNNRSRLDLRRITVDRNGDGTNGGLLNATGVNGALHSAFGMSFVDCSSSLFEDLEVYGSDSGTGILFRRIGETSRIIRPYVHDMGWVRTAATNDQAQGIWFDQCTRVPVVNPRAINLTGTLNGVSSRRFTRGIVTGGCVGMTLNNPYVERVDQGVDITGGPTPNRDVVVVGGAAYDIWTWGFKLANTARRCIVRDCRAYDCGVGFVASSNPDLTSDVTTDRSKFVDCVAYNSGSNGQTVASIAGFRVLENAATPSGRASNIEFIRCRAVDEQAVKTMLNGFSSEITNVAVAPILIDCESVGHTVAATVGLFRTRLGVVGTVSQTSGVPTGAIVERGVSGGVEYTRYVDGTQVCWATIDDAAAAWTTAHGAAFVRATPITIAYPKAFISTPTCTASAERNADGLAFGVAVRDCSTTTVRLTPYGLVSLGAGNAKAVHMHAIGRWF